MTKKLNLTIVMFALIWVSAQGQTFLKEFGKIGKDEIELKQYSEDEDAEAVVLFDIGKSYFVRTENAFDIVFERETRIKILSEAGIKWAEVEIPFYQEGGIYEKVYDIEAYSYNYENGVLNKTQLDLASIYDEKINNYWNVAKLAIPNVKEGTIIEYKYKIESQYVFNLRDWEFQWRIPVVYSEYEAKMIPFYDYTWLLQGADKFDAYDTYVEKGLTRQYGPIEFNDKVYKYAMEDVPAFNSEEFITSINDYITKIDFQLSRINHPDGSSVDVMTTWEEMNDDLLKHKDFGKYIQKSEKLAKKLLDTESLDLCSETEKFDKIIEYVKENYNWNNINGNYASKTPKKFIEEKYGNCADVNLFTTGLLNAAGIAAKPILISTRENGKIKYDYPFAHFFNYVIILATVDGTNVLTDATEVLNLNNRIPTRCINDKGLIVQKDKVEWVGLECSIPSKITTAIEIEFINDETIKSAVSNIATEYDASYFRTNYTGNIETIKNRLETTDYIIIDSTITVQNQLNKKEPYILAYEQTSEPEIVNEKIYLSPFLNETISDNPLTQNRRTYPIDMIYPVQRTYSSTILIPEGYKIDYVPDEQKINNELFELNYSMTSYENRVNISFAYYFKKSVYSAVDYSKIKFYFNEITKRGNEKIVLSKTLADAN